MNVPARLLLVDGDRRLVKVLEGRLKRDGYAISVATTGAEAIAAVEGRWPDLVVLDLVLPDMPGEQVAAAIKRRADLPIIVLSSIADASVKATVIREFAEDYLTKPAHYPELHARIERVLRRMVDRVPVEELSVAGGLVLRLRQREAIVDGERILLTRTESRVLAALAASPGHAVSTERILARVWGDADGADPVYVWVTMRRLRQKLEPDPGRPRFVHTVRGAGYRLGDAAPDAPG